MHPSGLRKLCFFAVLLGIICPTSSVQAQFLFGQNKVVYSSKEWRVITTPHLDVYYYEGEQELGEYIADYSENVCVEYDTLFDHEFTSRIPLIIYSSHHEFKQTNVIDLMISEYVGGFTELARGRVVIPHTGNWTQLREVTRHELVHAYMNNKLGTLMSKRQKYNFLPPPLWFSEGLAEYLAMPNGAGTEAHMFMRDFIVNEHLVDIANLWRIRGTFLMYKEGESLVRYIGQRFGDKALMQMLENWWFSDRFDVILDYTLGMEISDLNRDWKRYLKRRYYPRVMTAEWPEQHGKPLTKRRGINSRPAIIEPAALDRPFGFAFLSSSSGNVDIMLARKKDKQKTYDYTRMAQGGRGSNIESIPAFSSGPDAHGDLLAFTAKSGDRDALFIWDWKQQEQVDKLKFDSLVQINSPRWSPDGRQLVFAGLDFSGWSDLYTVNLDTQELTRITLDPGHDRDPDWSHDGRRIVWSSDRDAPEQNGIYHICVLELSNNKITRITSGDYDDAAPTWSPDDQFLLLSSDRNGVNNIYRYDFKRSTLTQVTATLGGLFTPQWTPDGKSFLAGSFNDLSFNIFQFDLDGQPSLPETSVPLVQLASANSSLPGTPQQGSSAWLRRSNGSGFPTRNYDVDFALDFVQGSFSYDPDFFNSSGAQIGFTDLLGNHRLAFLVANSGNDFENFFKHLNLGASYTNLSRRLNYTVGGFALTQLFDPRTNRFRFERRIGGLLGVSYPLSRFRRLESSIVARYAQLEEFDAQLGGFSANTFLISNFSSFVHDNTLWSFVGPVEGTRLNLTIGQTVDVGGGGRSGTSTHIDYRNYQRLGRAVFASRLIYRANWGNDSQFNFVGGPFDLRGFARRTKVAKRVALLNHELRFPLLDRLLIGLPFNSLEFGGFRGALFNDIAYLVNPGEEWVGSYGVGLEMGIGLGFVTRYNFGQTHNFNRVLDDFGRFFLGWDY